MITSKRNSDGLIEGLEYKYNEFGLIDWKAMIPKEYFVVNKQRFKDNPPDSIEGLNDKDLLILLNGIRWISRVRGYKSVTYPVIQSSDQHTTAVCSITWIKNCQDTEEITFSAIGDSNFRNTSGFGSLYLGPIAENRAFVRCVRGALGIEVLGFDEVQGATPQEKPNNMVDKSRADLKKLMKKYDYSFEDIKGKLVAAGNKDVENYSGIEQLPPNVVLELIGILKQIK